MMEVARRQLGIPVAKPQLGTVARKLLPGTLEAKLLPGILVHVHLHGTQEVGLLREEDIIQKLQQFQILPMKMQIHPTRVQLQLRSLLPQVVDIQV
jgi:hypothetical protein